jgi:trans-2,3-dihydro-3-hydroxyanthranilate isomerase
MRSEKSPRQRLVEMSTHTFYIVDVFAESKYAGNQLAVVRRAGDLTASQMQQIAQEMHFSETSFILSEEQRDRGYDVRIFTPEAQVPFAGHPTLGTAFVIREEILHTRVDQICLNLPVGQIPVTFDVDELWMDQIAPTFGPTRTVEEVAGAIGLESSDIDERYPIQEVSTGLPFLIVPLTTLDAAKRVQTDRVRLGRVLEGLDAEGVLVFAPETYHAQNQLNVRVLVPELGVPEDPATGSGNGSLAGYLVKHRYFGSGEINIRVEQGYEIGRPSLLLLRAKDRVGAVEVRVGGKVFPAARGEFV